MNDDSQEFNQSDRSSSRQGKTYGCIGVNDTEVTLSRYVTEWTVTR